MSVKPVAWLCDSPNHRFITENESISIVDAGLGYTVTPLYSAPAPELAEALQEIIESVDATELTYEAAYDLLKRGPWNKVRQLLARITPK